MRLFGRASRNARSVLFIFDEAGATRMVQERHASSVSLGPSGDGAVQPGRALSHNQGGLPYGFILAGDVLRYVPVRFLDFRRFVPAFSVMIIRFPNTVGLWGGTTCVILLV
jgi:hypothetical protein